MWGDIKKNILYTKEKSFLVFAALGYCRQNIVVIFLFLSFFSPRQLHFQKISIWFQNEPLKISAHVDHGTSIIWPVICINNCMADLVHKLTNPERWDWFWPGCLKWKQLGFHFLHVMYWHINIWPGWSIWQIMAWRFYEWLKWLTAQWTQRWPTSFNLQRKLIQ
jgi:hypothetical protein